jgi:hypothetical protein
MNPLDAAQLEIHDAVMHLNRARNAMRRADILIHSINPMMHSNFDVGIEQIQGIKEILNWVNTDLVKLPPSIKKE